jgi:hypothetical protein
MPCMPCMACMLCPQALCSHNKFAPAPSVPCRLSHPRPGHALAPFITTPPHAPFPAPFPGAATTSHRAVPNCTARRLAAAPHNWQHCLAEAAAFTTSYHECPCMHFMFTVNTLRQAHQRWSKEDQHLLCNLMLMAPNIQFTVCCGVAGVARVVFPSPQLPALRRCR